MNKVFILGAGSSMFARFPLGKQLLGFLKSEYNNSKDLIAQKEGEECLSFIDRVTSCLPSNRMLDGEPDLEFIMSLTDLNDGLDFSCEDQALLRELRTIRNQLQLSDLQLAGAKRGFHILAASAFTHWSYSVLNEEGERISPCFNRTVAAWSKVVKPGDVLISFNWDLLQEIILHRAGLWTPGEGYGLQICPEPSIVVPSPLILIKLHGSCTFSVRDRWDKTAQLAYEEEFFGESGTGRASKLRFEATSDYGASLIVPSYLKDPNTVGVLIRLWRKAYEQLTRATEIVVLGYSLPKADYFSRQLFTKAIGNNEGLEKITLVLGEDLEAYLRWEDIGAGKCVRTKESFESYVLTSSNPDDAMA